MSILRPDLAYGYSNLRGWWHAFDDFTCAERNALSTAMAYEGTGPGSAAWVERVRFGYPGMFFDGDAASGPVMSTLMQTTQKTVYVAFRVDAIPSSEANAWRDAAIWTGNSSACGVTLNDGGGGAYTMRAWNSSGGGAQQTGGLSIGLGEVHVAAFWHGSGGNQLYLKLNRGDFSKPANRVGCATAATTSLAGTLKVGRSQYNPGPTYYYPTLYVFELLCYYTGHGDEAGEAIVAYLLSQWGDRGDAVEIARAEAARRAWARGVIPRRPSVVLLPGARFDLLDLDLGDSIAFQHSRCPHRDGLAGAESIAAEKVNTLRLDSLSLDGDKMQLTVTGIETRLRDCGCLLRFDPPAGPSLWNEGAVVLKPGMALLFSKPSLYNTASSPVDYSGRYICRATDGMVVRIHAGQWPLAPEGLHAGIGGLNWILNSWFASGNTSWTRSSGGGGLTPAVETTSGSLWADAGLTTQNMLLTQDSPAVREKSVSQAYATSYANRIVIRYRNETGNVLVWRLVRTSDGKYWNNGTPDWQVGTCDNTLPSSTTITRFLSEEIPAPAAPPDTYTLSYVQLAGGTAGREDRVYEVGGMLASEAGSTMASSPVRTTTAIVYVTASATALTTGEASPFVSPERGTILIAFRADESYFTKGSGAPGLFTLNPAAGDRLGLYYDLPTETWHLKDGVAADATVAQAASGLTDGAYHWAAIRYASSAGGEYLEADTFQLIVDGQESEAVAYAGLGASDQLALLGFYFEGDPWAAASLWDVWLGWIRAIQTSPWILSPEECAAWARRHCR